MKFPGSCFGNNLIQGGVATGIKYLYWIAALFIFEATKVTLFRELEKKFCKKLLIACTSDIRFIRFIQ